MPFLDDLAADAADRPVVLPLFVISRFTGLLGTTWGLIVARLTFNLPFAIWIMNAFFAELTPRSRRRR